MASSFQITAPTTMQWSNGKGWGGPQGVCTYLDVCPSVRVSYLDVLVEFFPFLLACPLLCHLELSSLQGKVPPFFMTLGEDALLFLKEVLLKREESGKGEGGSGGEEERGRKGRGGETWRSK